MSQQPKQYFLFKAIVLVAICIYFLGCGSVRSYRGNAAANAVYDVKYSDLSGARNWTKKELKAKEVDFPEVVIIKVESGAFYQK